MIPHPWVSVVLVMGAFRVLRFVSWDDWPPIYRLRAWAIGEHWVPLDAETEPHLPGKQPTSEVGAVRPAYRRPLLAHLVHCPFCMGFWVSVATFVAWRLAPTETLYALAPFALSGAIGLIAKNWDP